MHDFESDFGIHTIECMKKSISLEGTLNINGNFSGGYYLDGEECNGHFPVVSSSHLKHPKSDRSNQSQEALDCAFVTLKPDVMNRKFIHTVEDGRPSKYEVNEASNTKLSNASSMTVKLKNAGSIVMPCLGAFLNLIALKLSGISIVRITVGALEDFMFDIYQKTTSQSLKV